ncbi:hypothetical protein STBA_49990 [Streptomyces sp. MP131-18]|nr:hypothetical protein STBA_49990 [Streptomyces sp. MP131-18]
MPRILVTGGTGGTLVQVLRNAGVQAWVASRRLAAADPVLSVSTGMTPPRLDLRSMEWMGHSCLHQWRAWIRCRWSSRSCAKRSGLESNAS